ncbi:hypothetical protein IDJ77_10250 [Mucilaginibacter sp. ZT4R22]|uniref:Pentapeptide repeat protein n=1 Tax=Mucilaginibacter pankratovii TaxID=2772110 RepID=A0ABR7WPE2_9SPHI|nr:hypothetical protein [Mucilaginibacter pankratovii]MBD1364190.1 hypothetical protein [Mucilaginibacter pankratovii]
MSAQPIHNITAERAMDLIDSGLPLIDVYVSGELKLPGSDDWDKTVVFENCIIERFEAIMVQFSRPVKFINTHFKDCQFIFSYFLQGLNIQNCSFDKALDFSSGGHNKPGYPISVMNNHFTDFVNFFDCQYEAEVEVIGNDFVKGTNIGCKNQLLSFVVAPQIMNNTGKIDLEETEWVRPS